MVDTFSGKTYGRDNHASPESVQRAMQINRARKQGGLAIGLALGIDDVRDWQKEALCRQTDPEVFFPEKGGSTREAKKICHGCEVRLKCLQYALDGDERFGIWGGLSERERRKLKRRK